MSAKKRRRRNSGASGIVGLAVIMLAVIVSMSLLFSRVFVVRDIQIRNNHTVPGEEILRQSGILLGESIFSIDPDAVVERFQYDGRLFARGVEKQYPDTIVITVEERKRAACVSFVGLALVIDENAVLISKEAALPDAELVTITGMEISTMIVGQPITSAIAGQTDTVKRLLAAIQASGLAGTFSEINVENLDMIYATTVGGLNIVLGDDGNLADKFLWMTGAMAELAKDGIATGRIDVSSANAAYYAAD